MKGRSSGTLKIAYKGKAKGMSVNYTLSGKRFKKMCIGTSNST